MRKKGIFLVLLLILAGINHSIWHTEQVLANGEEIILELAPVDPRSLMQGDYMALRFALGNDVQQALSRQQSAEKTTLQTLEGEAQMPEFTGMVVVQADELGIARLVKLDDGQPLQPQQLRVEYRLRHNSVQFATNAFFFQEGSGRQYEAARYGLFRVSADGQPYLTHLLDEKLEKIGASKYL